MSESPIEFVDDHFDTPDGQRDALDAPDDFPDPISRFTIRDISIAWYLYGGRDFASEYIPGEFNYQWHYHNSNLYDFTVNST